MDKNIICMKIIAQRKGEGAEVYYNKDLIYYWNKASIKMN